jgi:hypothetical protein
MGPRLVLITFELLTIAFILSQFESVVNWLGLSQSRKKGGQSRLKVIKKNREVRYEPEGSSPD